jgi:GTPase SAR1 family protein
MARKFGKKKEISINPLDYNIGLAGISGVGKTTLIKNVCEKLVGDEGYLMLDIGKESGHDCIDGIVSETIPDWDTLDEVLDDIIDNRATDYQDLKVVVFDTLDELFVLGEEEAIRQYNKTVPADKRANSINSVNGGFGKGLDACIDLVLNRIWSLKEVGISFIVIVHTKAKDVEDPITGQTYQVITANMSQRYFNAIKTKLDILGVAYIDREIIKEKIEGRKDIKGKDITRNVVAAEARKIAFRSDDYNLDSKCRFPQIISEIPLDTDEFIKAIEDAIKAEQSKSGKSFDETKKEQEAVEAAKMKEIAEAEKVKKTQKEVDKLMADVIDYIKENKSNKSKIQPILDRCKEAGVKPTDITDIDLANELYEMIG